MLNVHVIVALQVWDRDEITSARRSGGGRRLWRGMPYQQWLKQRLGSAAHWENGEQGGCQSPVCRLCPLRCLRRHCYSSTPLPACVATCGLLFSVTQLTRVQAHVLSLIIERAGGIFLGVSLLGIWIWLIRCIFVPIIKCANMCTPVVQPRTDFRGSVLI